MTCKDWAKLDSKTQKQLFAAAVAKATKKASIVNSKRLALAAQQAGHDFCVFIRVFARKFLFKRQRFPGHIENTDLTRLKVPQARALSAPALA